VNVQAALLENWPYKVAAIILAILLWLNVTADVERQDQGIATRLEFEVTDPAWAIARAPTEVTTFFQGRRGAIIALLNQPVIHTVLEEVEDSVVEVTLDPADVEFDRSLAARATAVSPPRVEVHLEPRESRAVPVAAVSDARGADDLILRDVVVRPESVTVSGPRSAVNRVTELRTERLEVGEIAESTTRFAGLDPPAGIANLEIDPDRVTVAFEVDSILARRFQLTVAAEGTVGDSIALEPPVVLVTLRGPAGIVSTLAATDLSATVAVDQVPPAPRTFPVTVHLPTGVEAQAVAEPARVTASRREIPP